MDKRHTFEIKPFQHSNQQKSKDTGEQKTN